MTNAGEREGARLIVVPVKGGDRYRADGGMGLWGWQGRHVLRFERDRHPRGLKRMESWDNPEEAMRKASG